MREITKLKLNTVKEAAANPYIGPAEKTTLSISSENWKASIFTNHTQLETVWRRMETEGHCTAFQTYEWAACWYDAVLFYGAAEPLIVTVSKNGESPAWIFPLCIYEKKGLWVISFADMGFSDYVAPVIAKGAPSDQKTTKAMMRAFLKSLPPCDIIHFQKITERVQGMPNPFLQLHGIKSFPAGCYGIRLRQPWPELAEKIMQRRLKATIRQQKKKIKRRGKITVEQFDKAETLGPALDRLLAMRDARFEATGRPCLPPLWRSFYRNLATRKCQSVKASITEMKVADETVAACFGVTLGNNYYALLPTISMGKWERFRPGMLLFDAMLTSFAEQTRNDGYFDFTVGDEVYKKRFGCETHVLYEWMSPRSLAGLSAFSAWRLKVFLRRYPRLLSMLKKIVNRARFLISGIPEPWRRPVC